MSAFEEFKRRNVFRVGAAYLAGAWLLVQIINEVFPLFGWPEYVGRFAVLALAIGFVPALIVAWLYELGPEGLRRDSGAHSLERTARGSARRFDRTVIIVLALALAWFAVDRFMPQSELDRSIAVLAFEDLSEAGDQEHFSDGISEELLNLLTKVPGLRVVGRTSAFSFKGKDATIVEIADALNVNYVLEGSVRRSGERIRITAQLIEAQSDTHLLSETYDREFGDIFAIQDEIAAKIVDRLQIELVGSAPTVDEVDPDLYAMYSLARHITESVITERLPEAQSLLEHVVEEAPDYAPAREALATAYMAAVRRTRADPRELWQRAKQTIDEAVERWPERPELIAFDGWLGYVFDRKPENLEFGARAYERALSIDPGNHTALLGALRFSLIVIDDAEAAIEIGEYLLARDPICLACYENLMLARLANGDYERVQELFETARRLDLNVRTLKLSYAISLLRTGNGEAALAEFEAAELSEDEEAFRLMWMAASLHAMGSQTEFEAKTAELRAITADHPIGYVPLAHLYAEIGDLDSAFGILNAQAVLPYQIQHNELGLHMREDPRWNELLTKMQPDPAEGVRLHVNLPD